VGSERQRKAGYLLPEQIDGHPLMCVSLKIPDVEEYRAAFVGALYTLAQWWSWEKSFEAGDTRATEAATYWRKLLLEEMCMPAVCPIDLRQNPFDPCEIQKSTDGVNWVTAWRDDLCITELPIPIVDTLATLQQNLYETNYNGNPSSINPNAPDDFFSNNATRETALCMAVNSWVGSVVSQFVEKGKLALGLSIFTIIASGFLGPLGAAVGVLVSASLLLLSAAAIEAAQDSEAVKDVMCCMIEGLTGDAISFANFQLALSSCGFTGGSNSQILADVVTAELESEANYLAFLDLLGKGYILAQAGVACEAVCDSWSHHFLSGDGAIAFDTIVFGTYNSGDDRYDSVHQPENVRRIIQVNAVPGTVFRLNRVELEFVTHVQNPFTGRPTTIYYKDELGVGTALAQIVTSVTGTYQLDTGEISVRASEVVLEIMSRTNGEAQDFCRLTSVTIHGSGFDPFA